MKVLLGYDAGHRRGIISSTDAPGSGVWTRIADEARQADPGARFVGERIELVWPALLRCVNRLSNQQARLGFQFDAADDVAKRMLTEYVAQARRIAELRDSLTVHIDQPQMERRLLDAGFVRKLKPYQFRDVAHLASLPNGANFSVPGAGKTSVTLALHAIVGVANLRLLVVAPKNAFGAWDDVITDAVKPGSSLDGRFLRLNSDNLAAPYSIDIDRTKYFIVSYDIAARNPDGLSSFLSRAPFHLVLDESHRIKAGDERLRGAAILAVSSIPIRKDILSGTPAPNSQRDLEPQIEFLFPGLPYSQQIGDTSSPRDVLRRLFVRTTKAELGLLPPRITYQPVAMGKAQLGLYSLLKAATVRQIMESKKPGSAAQLRARRCVMYFLMSSVNPIATVRALGHRSQLIPASPETEALYRAVLSEGDSHKVLAACRYARELVSKGNKVLIWTIFTETISRLEDLLADLNPVSLHGGVATGDAADPDTREGRIKRFLRRSNDAATDSWVMIANPAAASEGMSLHTECHHAIYLDRSYNAAHFLQSLDRINRIGLAPGQETFATVLETVAPVGVGSIDYSVRNRLRVKIRGMQNLLDDPDLGVLADFEEYADIPVDQTIDMQDIEDLLDELTTRRARPDDDE